MEDTWGGGGAGNIQGDGERYGQWERMGGEWNERNKREDTQLNLLGNKRINSRDSLLGFGTPPPQN